MDKKFIVSAVAMSVVSLLLGFVVHAQLLHGEYLKLPNLFRAEADAQNYFGYMLAAHVSLGIGLTWLYRRGREAKPWLGQGLRFGAAVVLLMTIPMYLIYFAVQPMPADLVAQQIVYDTICTLIMGVVVAWLNR